MHNDLNDCFMSILICISQFSRSSRDTILSELMLKHKYKSLHYDQFVVIAEFVTYSYYIIYIYDYSNHKTVDIIYIMYMQYVTFAYR